jgi:hypothetical protein
LAANAAVAKTVSQLGRNYPLCKSSQRHRCANPTIVAALLGRPPRGEASVRNLPVNLFASVMGLSGLALAWRVAHTGLGAPAVVGEAIGAFAVVVFLLLAVGYLTKLVQHPEVVRAEFHHPVAGNFFGTIVISVLLLSAGRRAVQRTAARTPSGPLARAGHRSLSFVVCRACSRARSMRRMRAGLAHSRRGDARHRRDRRPDADALGRRSQPAGRAPSAPCWRSCCSR